MKPLDSKTGYARYAAIYDKSQEYWNSFEQRFLTPYIHRARGKKVLDAGAGTGRIAIRLHQAGATVTALDLSPEMLIKLRQKNPAIEAVEGDMEAMPFADETFDMIFSSLAIVHLKDTEEFLEEAYRTLKDNGELILVSIHYRKPMILDDKDGKYTIQCFNHFPDHLRKAAESLAFGVEKEIFVTEGDKIWISQILVLKK